MKKKFMPFIIGLFLLILSERSHALIPFLYLSPYASFGMGEAVVENEAQSPKTGMYQLGATVALEPVPLFFLGVDAAYENVVQYSDPNNSYGNRMGTRIGYGPTIGFRFLVIKAQYTYIMGGDYELGKKNSSNETVTYKEPKGHKIAVSFSVMPFVMLGVYYQTVMFDKLSIGATETNPTRDLSLNHYGLVLSLNL